MNIAAGKVHNYNADRQPTGETLPTGLSIIRQYPAVHRAGSIDYSAGGLGPALSRGYEYNKRGWIAQAGVQGDTMRTFTYDPLGRLTHWSELSDTEPSCTWHEVFGEKCTVSLSAQLVRTDTFRYDLVGNRTDEGAAIETGNRLTSFAGYTLVYDADGNLTRKYRVDGSFDQHLHWNSLGQLDSVTTSGATLRYGYDGWGRRIRRSTDAGMIRYVYDGDHLFLEVDGSGNLLREYAHHPGIDQPHSLRQWEGGANGAVYYYATELPGHVAGLISASNQLTNEYRYTPFGTPLPGFPQEGTPNPLRYMAREMDSGSGLYYFRNRWYDPEITRFTSEDPIGLEGGINPYVFAENNPVNFTDPWGLQAKSDPCKERGLELLPDGQCGLIVRGAGGGSGPSWRSGRGSGLTGSGGMFGGGGGFGGGGAGRSWDDVPISSTDPDLNTDVLDLATLLARHYSFKLMYAPKQWKTDKFHAFSKSNDLNIVLTGQVVETRPDGYVVYALQGKLGRHTGRYEIGGYPLNTGQPGLFVTHRFFRKR